MVLIEVSFDVDVAGAVALGKPSLHQSDERLVFLNDIRGELRTSGAAEVLHRVDRTCRHKQDLAGLHRQRLAADPLFQGAFEKVDDLFAGMRMLRREFSRVEFDTHLGDLASRNT